MKVPIIRIKSYLEGEVIEFGSGIILFPDHVLTAAHVVCGDSHTVIWDGEERPAVVEKKNHTAALLALGTALEGAAEQIKFTNEELLAGDTAWCTEGFITDEQSQHQIAGKGLVYTECQEQGTDFRLKDIEIGYAENYQGMSGSPVVCRDRVVGMLQMQNYTERGLLGLEMSSTDQFKELLPAQFIGSSQYIEEFEASVRDFTEKAIEKNISSKKYIPDIFVEEGSYKENFRYFAEPDLFLKKVMEDLEALDLRPVNRFLNHRNQKELDFTDIAGFASEHTISETSEMLIRRLDAAVKKIDKARNQADEPGLSREKRYLREAGSSYAILYTLERMRDEICFFRYKILMITKPAGQGKTNFLCDFTRNFLLKKGFAVLFYNAYDFREPFMNLIRRELTVDGTYTWEYVRQALSQRWERTHRAVIIVIDGLNENTALNDFGGYVSDFLKETQKLPFLKVVLSTRNELLEERFGQLNPEELGSSFCRMDMYNQSEKFSERIFWGYLKYFDIEIMENTLLSQTYRMLTEDTLLLRFFCEVNRGKRQVRMLHVYKYRLFEKYYEMKKQESVHGRTPGKEAIFDRLIDHICQVMIDSRQFSQIPRSELTEEELTVFDRLLESEVIFKQEVQVNNGLLEEKEIFLGFTFDEFRDFCITRHILRNSNEKTFSELWKRMHLENWSILEGVERYIFFLARTENKGLLAVLQREEEYEEIYWENVWELEEPDITTEDIRLWREEMMSGRPHAPSVGKFLLAHRDRSYFKKISIDLLFEMLDQLADDLAAFGLMTQKLFGKTQKDSYGREIRGKDTVLPCDKLTEKFREYREDTEFIKNYRDFLRLSVYMVEIDAYVIGTMWADAYIVAAEEVEELLEIYVKKEDLPRLIYHNVEIILAEVLRKAGKNKKLKQFRTILDRRLQRYDYQKINESLASVWNS